MPDKLFQVMLPKRSGNRWFTAALVALPLAAFTAVFLSGGPPPADAVTSAGATRAATPAPDAEALRRRVWPTTADALDAEQPRLAQARSRPASLAGDTSAARFTLCRGSVRVTCVVDGDTIWFEGEKIRLADINAPEVSSPGCAREAELGARATRRLAELLNQGPFTLAANQDGTGRDRDRYGRELRVVMRGGASLGEVLVREGLAEEWRGYRRNWC